MGTFATSKLVEDETTVDENANPNDPKSDHGIRKVTEERSASQDSKKTEYSTEDYATSQGQSSGLVEPPEVRVVPGLDLQQPTPEYLKKEFKSFKVLDAKHSESLLNNQKWKPDPMTDELDVSSLVSLLQTFMAEPPPLAIAPVFPLLNQSERDFCRGATAFESTVIPGLKVFRSFLPPTIQKLLVKRLLGRDLATTGNRTNLHRNYTFDYPSGGLSFFDYSKNGKAHDNTGCNRTLQFKSNAYTGVFGAKQEEPTLETILTKKLRWITVGRQYNWDDKTYGGRHKQAPAFPEDIRDLIQGLCPLIAKPEAAIVNVYDGGQNIMGLHRDISEEVNRPLISISLGCSATFVIGNEADSEASGPHHVITLESGDILCMADAARYSWHGVPRIHPKSCPEYLHSAVSANPDWAGYMKNKRINLNIRQVFEENEGIDDQVKAPTYA